MSLATPASNAQIEALIDFMSQHRKLACAKMRSTDGRLRAKQLWETLSKSLNSMGGCTKTVEQWQRVWADKKYLVKKAALAARRAASAGGDGADAPTLSQVDLKLLSIMGDGNNETESFAMVPALSSSLFILSPIPTKEEPRDDSSILSSTSSDTQSHVQPHVFTEELPTPNKRSFIPRRGRPRVLRSISTSTRRRLIELEERRNEVLGEIRDAIVDLSSLLREHISRNN